MKGTIAAIAAFSLCAVSAQDNAKQETVEKRIMMVQGAAQPHAGAAFGAGVVMHYGGNVKGAPYVAETVTESIQALADGNRIINRQTSRMYRDSEGRTRMDNSFQPLGPWVPEGGTVSISMITDPVSGEHYTLDHARKTATRGLMKTGAVAVAGGGPRDVRAEVRKAIELEVRKPLEAGAAHAHDVLAPHAAGRMIWVQEGKAASRLNVKQEQLGKRVIEGVECEGTRESFTIAAGEVGNERPIEVVTERWYAPELKMDVYRKHTDPRFGENIFRMTHLARTEQPRSLFEPPSDYKLEEPGRGAQTIRFERKH
jgi:hypothetical protein